MRSQRQSDVSEGQEQDVANIMSSSTGTRTHTRFRIQHYIASSELSPRTRYACTHTHTRTLPPPNPGPWKAHRTHITSSNNNGVAWRCERGQGEKDVICTRTRASTHNTQKDGRAQPRESTTQIHTVAHLRDGSKKPKRRDGASPTLLPQKTGKRTEAKCGVEKVVSRSPVRMWRVSGHIQRVPY